MSVITLDHPDGSVRLDVPRDVPIGELMMEFLEVTGQPDRRDWALRAADGRICRADKTLADLDVVEGSVLVLHARDATNGASRSASEVPDGLTHRRAPAGVIAPRSDRVTSSRGGGRDAQLAVSARMTGTLPLRLTRSDRLALAAHAVLTRRPIGSAVSDRCAPGAIGDPATFTLPAPVSPVARMREAWAQTAYDRLLERPIVAPRLRRCATIAVVSPKGGVGKSTTTALLGSLLAHLRRDRVVAVDTNPDWGSLGRRLVPDHPVFIDDLLAGPLKDGRLSATLLDAQLGRGPDGLMVAPAPIDPVRARALDEHAYRTLFTGLGELVGTLVLDCGTGLDSPAAHAALAAADQILLVADGEPDTASIVAEAAHYLQRHAPPLVLVVNKLERSSRLDVDALEREIPFATGIVRIPTSRAGAEQLHASHFSWTHAPRGWTTPLWQLATVLVSDWRRLNIAQ